jgi:hypothetical protein
MLLYAQCCTENRNNFGLPISAVLVIVRRYFQDLWMGSFQAISVAVDSGSVGVMSMGRSSSFPL